MFSDLEYDSLNSQPGYSTAKTIYMICSNTGDVFFLQDGYIPLSRSISVATLLSRRSLPPWDSLHSSSASTSFYIEAKIVQQPFDTFSITPLDNLYPAVRHQITVAPIYQTGASCLDDYGPNHLTCNNTVLGFACLLLYKILVSGDFNLFLLSTSPSLSFLCM